MGLSGAKDCARDYALERAQTLLATRRVDVDPLVELM